MLKIKVNYMEIKESRQFLIQRKYPESRYCFCGKYPNVYKRH
jgi:hypothetical protein